MAVVTGATKDGSFNDLGIAAAGITGFLTGSEVVDTASVAAGAENNNDVTVTGAALGDWAIASFGVDIVDATITCHVTAADVVTVQLANLTAGRSTSRRRRFESWYSRGLNKRR